MRMTQNISMMNLQLIPGFVEPVPPYNCWLCYIFSLVFFYLTCIIARLLHANLTCFFNRLQNEVKMGDNLGPLD